MGYKNIEDKRASKRRWASSIKGKMAREREKYTLAYAVRHTKKTKDRQEAQKAWRKNLMETVGGVWIEALYGCIDDREKKRILREYNASIGCKCGNTDGRVLRFSGGEHGPVAMLVEKYSGYSLMQYITGLIIECSNCYRITTAAGKSIRQKLEDEKSSRGCCRCGNTDGRCLDYHHPDKELKVAAVSTLARQSFSKAIEEAKKCLVICSNCHILEHWDEGTI